MLIELGSFSWSGEMLDLLLLSLLSQLSIQLMYLKLVRAHCPRSQCMTICVRQSDLRQPGGVKYR